jgi:hypothetical protein
MPQQSPLIRASIDALKANVAVLDRQGLILDVNDRWRRFGNQRNAVSDYVGLNYLDVCSKAAEGGDRSAKRVESGLRRLLTGNAQTFGLAYRCGDRTFRMQARTLGEPLGGLLVAHEDITAFLRARSQRSQSDQTLNKSRGAHATRIDTIHEELGQRLTGISLAVDALEAGGEIADAVALIRMAVDEARHELRLRRYEARQEVLH